MFQAALDAFARVDEIAKGDVRAQVERARVLAAWAGHRERGARGASRGDRDSRSGAATRKAGSSPPGHSTTSPEQQHDNALRREALREIVEADADDYEAWDELARLSDGQRSRAARRSAAS